MDSIGGFQKQFSSNEIKNKLISDYCNNPTNYELEFRFSVDKKSFLKFVDIITTDDKDLSFSFSLSTMNKSITGKNQPLSNIMLVTYFSGENRKDRKSEYRKKTRLTPIYIYKVGGIRLVLSIENELKGASLNRDNALYRLKCRVSKNLGNFQADFTTVAECNNFDTMKKYITDVYVNIQNTQDYIQCVNNFIELPEEYPNTKVRYEIEFEVTNKNISANDFEEIEKEIFEKFINKNVSEITLKYTIEELSKIIRYSEGDSLKLILPQVITLNKLRYLDVYHNINEYMCSEKTDGYRCVLQLNGTNLKVIYTQVEEYTIPTSKINGIIFDAEKDEDEIHLFDIAWSDNSIHEKSYKERYDILLNFDISIFKDCKYKVNVKRFYMLTTDTYKEIFTDLNAKIVNNKGKYDGIIITYAVTNYNNTITYKWKPIEYLSIDFSIKKTDTIKDKNVYQLFITRKDIIAKKKIPALFKYPEMGFSTEYFATELDLDENKIYELKINKDTNIIEIEKYGRIINWEILKERKDRAIIKGFYYGNGEQVAIDIFSTIINNFDINELISFTPGYFSKVKDEKYFAHNAFNSYVKSKLISKCDSANVVIDIGCGKGQDIKRYFDIFVKNLYCYDIDKDALQELISRASKLFQFSKYSTLLKVAQCDFNSDNIIPCLPNDKINYIYCNYAIHYLINNLEQILEILSNYVIKDSAFIITFYSGKDIFELLSKQNSYDLYEDNSLKFSIKKAYKDNILLDKDQEIQVLLPFSNGEYYTEYLVNEEYIIKIFEKYSWKVEKSEYFIVNKSEFEVEQKKIIDRYNEKNKIKKQPKIPTDIDYRYIELEKYIIFRHE